MAREHGTSAQPWGTLEELLLVCAVNRHGTQSWDSVALEVGSRCSATATTLLTAHNCRDKFEDIKRRFVSEDDDDDDDDSSGSLGAMVDELRRLRVEELRREVRRRDVSIVSLELKVKRLEEERERSLKEEAEATRPSKDLKRRGEDQREGSPENLTGKMNSGSYFNSDERENRSFNESNSTSQRGEAKGNGATEKQAEGEEDKPEPDGNKPDPIRAKIRSEPDRDCSVNGKVADGDGDDEDNQNNNNKKGGDDSAKASRLGESSELWESGGESKREGKRGGGGAAASRQQNSDVQSSASLSKRKRRRGSGGEGGGSRSRSRSSSGEEAEGDEVSPATRKGVKQLKLVKSEPLIKVLRIIRSHRLGSVFERRLRSQESERYKSLIRQHMDLHVIQSKLNKGVYAEDCIQMLFRDLLLLFNNAVVFFGKNSPEHNAAQELRSIVLKEMNDQLQKPQPATGTVTSNVPKIETRAPKIEPDGSEKPTKSSIVVCGKRASVNALSEGGAKNRKGDKVEEKAKAANEKKTDGAAFVKVEDKGIRKRRTQERGGRRGSSSRGRNAAKPTKPTKPHQYGVNELSSHDGVEALKAEKEKKENGRKKQGAARFLKRMKQNSSSTEVKKENSDGSEEDSEESEDEKKKKKKKKPTTRGMKKPEVERKERVTRSSTGSGGGRGGGRRCQESNGRGRRGAGRPPKRPETAAAGAGSGKRGRDNGEADQVGSAGRPRKRTRR